MADQDTTPDEQRDIERKLAYLITSSELADIVGVGRSTVSNWRDRYADTFPFPEPVVEGRSPQFDAEEVLDWVTSDSSPVEARKPPTSAWWWGKAVEAFHTDHIAQPTREFLSALVLLNAFLVHGVGGVVPEPDRWHSLEGHSDPLGLLGREARRAEKTHPVLSGLLTEPLGSLDVTEAVVHELVRRLGDVSSNESAAIALETMLRRTEDHSAGSRQVETPAELARLMCLLVDVAPGRSVLDPAHGEGVTLLAAANEAAASGGTAKMFGQELDVAAWRIATTRFLIHGVEANLAAPGHDSISDDQWPGLQADAVVVDTPVGAGAPPVVRWVDHAMSHVAERGRVVVALPAHAIVDVSSARRSTAAHLVAKLEALLELGHIEGVVVTPRRARSDVIGPMTLWVLRPEATTDRDVLVVSPLETRLRVRSTSAEDLSITPDDVGDLFRAWRQKDELTPAADRPRLLVRREPAFRVISSLREAVRDVGPATTSGSTRNDSTRTSTTRRKDADRQRRKELEIHVNRLIELVELNLEVLWEQEKMAYMAARNEISAIRRLL